MDANRPKIPASVGILTLNSKDALPGCIESVRDFADIYICDGNSTDGTQELAKSLGARVVKQFDTDEPLQRIVNFGEACTKCMNAGLQDWYLRLDSDERMSPEALEEIRAIATNPNPPFPVYKTPRKYVWRGSVIDHAMTYPNLHIRFFRRDAVEKWTKVSHEKIIIKEGEPIGFMKGAMYAPYPDTYEELDRGRFKRAIHWDKLHFKNYGLKAWAHAVVHTSASLVIFSWRLLRIQLFARGTKLPLSYELWRFKYLIVTTWNATVIVWRKTLFGR